MDKFLKIFAFKQNLTCVIILILLAVILCFAIVGFVWKIHTEFKNHQFEKQELKKQMANSLKNVPKGLSYKKVASRKTPSITGS